MRLDQELQQLGAFDRIKTITVNRAAIEDSIDVFARMDGFANAESMHQFWLKFHGEGCFHGTLVSWLQLGVCQYCACTDRDCTQCVEAQGSPCYWVDEYGTVCSRCHDEGADA